MIELASERARFIVAGLVLLYAGLAHAITFNITGFVIEGENPLRAAQTQRLLKPFLGQHSNLERLRAATKRLETALQKRGYAFHRVSLPPQTLKDGAVRLQISALKIGKVSTVGNQFFLDENLKRSLPQLRANETPNSKQLTRVLAVANANTAKRTQLTFGRGAAPGSMDAQINVNDSDPTQVFGWINNTGNEQSTDTRLGLGYSHRNLWGRDHQLNLSGSISPEDTDRVSQYGINYLVPIYQTAGMVNILGAKSKADTGRVAEVFDVSGGGTTLGLGYTQILNKVGVYRQQLQFKAFDKLFDNNVDFAGQDIGQNVRSRPVSLAYQGEWTKNSISGILNIAHSTNLSGGRYNDDASYMASRLGANQDWQKSNLSLNLEHLSQRQWSTSFGFSAQQTSDPLISGEKFGLGGVAGPRGFEEREASFDKGYLANLMIWAPPLKRASVGGFYNTGYGSILNPQAGEFNNDTLSSAGLGLRWNWRGKLIFEGYYGYVLDGIKGGKPAGSQDGDSKVHFNLMYRF